MNNPLISKLSAFAELDDDDRRYIEGLCVEPRVGGAGKVLVDAGATHDKVLLLLHGWACRYKFLADGSRQIMAYLVPGDLCDVHGFILKRMDHGIALLSNAEYVEIPKAKITEMLFERPNLGRALWWSTLVDEAVLREWLANMGQRRALPRLAHLFCELWMRLREVDLVVGDEFTLPLTQEEIGDTMGLTSVHVNRTLQQMRNEGVISLVRGQLVIHDIERLKAIAEFDPNYLHYERRERMLSEDKARREKASL